MRKTVCAFRGPCASIGGAKWPVAGLGYRARRAMHENHRQKPQTPGEGTIETTSPCGSRDDMLASSDELASTLASACPAMPGRAVA
jgi:hypothetical protein